MQINELIVNPFKDWKYEISVLVIFSICLGILQFYFLKYGFENPGILGYCYLTNLVNLDWEHFFINIFVMWFGLFFVFILTTREQKVRFWLNLLLILGISPIILSILNIVFITATTGKTTLGYSGISSIFLGYGFLSLALFIHTAWKNNLLKRNLRRSHFFSIIGILIIFPIILFTFFADPIEISLILTYGLIGGIYQTFLQARINIFIHIIGYIIGLIIPLITRKIVPV